MNTAHARKKTLASGSDDCGDKLPTECDDHLLLNRYISGPERAPIERKIQMAAESVCFSAAVRGTLPFAFRSLRSAVVLMS